MTLSPGIGVAPAAQGATPATALSLRDLHKVYGGDVHALRGIDLEIADGEFVTLLGPSGSGKTTLLMVLGGFEQATRGTVHAGDVDITAVPPERRSFGVVFQSYALFPHMSVARNVAYPLGVRRVPTRERASRVEEALALVGLEGLGDRRPAQLSGGQQQRVALARALVYRPSVLLLDEPLGALDRALRERMQVELRRLHRTLGVTFVYVTHDQDEALTMSDRIVVMRDGQIEQIGTPDDVYARPATEFVATFVGRANLLRGRVRGAGGGVAGLELGSGATVRAPITQDGLPSEVVLVVRPERVHLADPRSPPGAGEQQLEGRLVRVTFAGSSWRYDVATPDGEVQAHLARRLEIEENEVVHVRWAPDDGWLVPTAG